MFDVKHKLKPPGYLQILLNHLYNTMRYIISPHIIHMMPDINCSSLKIMQQLKLSINTLGDDSK